MADEVDTVAHCFGRCNTERPGATDQLCNMDTDEPRLDRGECSPSLLVRSLFVARVPGHKHTRLAFMEWHVIAAVHSSLACLPAPPPSEARRQTSPPLPCPQIFGPMVHEGGQKRGSFPGLLPTRLGEAHLMGLHKIQKGLEKRNRIEITGGYRKIACRDERYMKSHFFDGKTGCSTRRTTKSEIPGR